MTYYAVLQDGSDMCMAIVSHKRTDLHLIDKNYVSIPSLDHSYINRIFDRENEQWTDKWLNKTENMKVDPVMEKLNSIETRLDTLTADSMTVENVTSAILEGVNEV